MADEDQDQEENERTTVLVYQSTRKRIKRLAGIEDVSYDELINKALDKLEPEINDQ